MSISEANIIIQEIDGSDVNNQTGMEEIDSISMRVEVLKSLNWAHD